jgi:radical SAM superfamily enzyme YgiQ (UPF0313 family)
MRPPPLREVWPAQLADELRAADVTVVLGGLHAAACPDEALQLVDTVVLGEGEPHWSRLLDDFSAGSLARQYGPAHTMRLFDDGLPVPRYDLLEPGRYDRIPLQTICGCPLDCAFCAASRLIAPYRKKPPAQIRRELEAILAYSPAPFIELADDNTFVDKRWALELVEVLADYPIRWFTETDVSVADDPVLLERLAAAGCAQLLIGFESVDVAALSETDSRGGEGRASRGGF